MAENMSLFAHEVDCLPVFSLWNSYPGLLAQITLIFIRVIQVKNHTSNQSRCIYVTRFRWQARVQLPPYIHSHAPIVTHVHVEDIWRAHFIAKISLNKEINICPNRGLLEVSICRSKWYGLSRKNFLSVLIEQYIKACFKKSEFCKCYSFIHAYLCMLERLVTE